MLGQATACRACAVIDNAYGGLYCLVLQDKVIDGVLFAVIVCGFFGAGEDEDAEIGYVFASDMILCIYILDPLAACIASEEYNHVCRGEAAADDFNDEV